MPKAHKQSPNRLKFAQSGHPVSLPAPLCPRVPVFAEKNICHEFSPVVEKRGTNIFFSQNPF
jgi:hypothetical protein